MNCFLLSMITKCSVLSVSHSESMPIAIFPLFLMFPKWIFRRLLLIHLQIKSVFFLRSPGWDPGSFGLCSPAPGRKHNHHRCFLKPLGLTLSLLSAHPSASALLELASRSGEAGWLALPAWHSLVPVVWGSPRKRPAPHLLPGES